MRHVFVNQHCTMCGAELGNRGMKCNNCHASHNQYPVWPWSSCQANACQNLRLGWFDWVQLNFAILGWLRFAAFIAMPIIGSLYLVIGFPAASWRSIAFGLLLLAWWIADRCALKGVLSSERRFAEQQVKARAADRQFREDMDAGGRIENEDEARKAVKDEYDSATGLHMETERDKTTRVLVHAFGVLSIWITVASFGSGTLSTVTYDYAKGVAEYHLRTSKTLDNSASVFKTTQNQFDLERVKNVLLGDRQMPVKDFTVVLNHPMFSANWLFKALETTPETGETLKGALLAKLAKVKPEAKKPVPLKPELEKITHWHKFRTVVFVVMLILCLINALVVLGLLVYRAASQALHNAYLLGNEAQDQFSLMMRKLVGEKQKRANAEVAAAGEAPAPAATATTTTTRPDGFWHTALGLFVMEMIAEFVSGRLMRKGIKL